MKALYSKIRDNYSKAISILGFRKLTDPYHPPIYCWGPLHVDQGSVFLHFGGRWKEWSCGIHVDHYWSHEVKELGAPERIYLNLGPLGSITVGLPTNHVGWMVDPEDDTRMLPYGRKGPWHWERCGTWSPSTGFYDSRYTIIAYKPADWMQCKAQSPPHKNRLGKDSHWICGARKGHKGPHCWEREDFPYKGDWKDWSPLAGPEWDKTS